MTLEFVLRLIGMVVLAVGGFYLGNSLRNISGPQWSDARVLVSLTLAGAAIGLLVTPWLTIKPVLWLRHQIQEMPASKLISGIIGLVIGLSISALLAPTLALVPISGGYMPFIASMIFGALGIMVMVMRHQDIYNVFSSRISRNGLNLPSIGKGSSKEDFVLIDTSVIIDGRIADITKTGFIRGIILIPRFVLAELQHIADSSDSIRRNRGRRGLDILNRLRKEATIPIRITDMDVEDEYEVDSKLVRLARQLGCPIITNDYNLNRIAEFQGVTVLNINELANAVKTVFLPGEEMQVRIIQEGKEQGQGVGYLDDGTMVVVENGKRSINRTIRVNVTKVLNTAAGRMIFAQPQKE